MHHLFRVAGNVRALPICSLMIEAGRRAIGIRADIVQCAKKIKSEGGPQAWPYSPPSE
jgi:hypothetical protein